MTTAAQSPAAVTVPAQLPTDIIGFTGRKPQLAILDSLLSGNPGTPTLATITGTGGAGKSALAIHWGRRNQDRFPGGQLYINLRGFDPGEPVSAREALSRFLHALGLSGDAVPSDVETAASLFRSVIADRRMLVVLDNARDLEQVGPLLPGGTDNLTLVTSRHRLAALTVSHGAVAVDVAVLSRGESVAVLRNMVGAGRLESEAEASERIADLCADLPLALRIAGANLVAQPYRTVRSFADELDGPNRLEKLSVDGDSRAAVAGTFSLSFQALPPDIQRFFSVLGLIPGDDFSEDLAAALGDAPYSEVRLMLRRLAAGHLVEEHGNRRYRLHDLVKAYARRTAEDSLSASARDAVADRVVEWFYTNRNHQASEEYGNLVATFRAWRDHPRCLTLIPAFVPYINVGRDLNGMRQYLDEADSLATGLNEPFGLYRVANALAIWASMSGDTEAAVSYGIRAVTQSTEHNGDSRGIARGNLGLIYSTRGEYRQALRFLRPAVKAAVASGNPTPFHILNLANVHVELGDYGKAHDCLRSLDSLDSAITEGASSTWKLGVLTQIHTATGQFDLALETAEAGLVAARRQHNQRHECIAQMRRGEVRRRIGDFSSAYDDNAASMELARRLRLSKQEANAIAERGLLLCEMDETAAARDLIPVLTSTAETATNTKRRSEAHLTLATIYRQLGDHPLTIRCGSIAAEHFAVFPVPLEHARALSLLADAHAALGDTESARPHYETALAIFTRLGAPEAKETRRQLDLLPDGGR